MNRRETYIRYVLPVLPRLITQLNKNKFSDTYGCFERSYWQYQMKDFPSVIAQYAAYSISMVYKLNHPENPFFENQILLEWCKGSLNYWVKMQNSDGSFNEAYPGDRSQPGTAFGLYFTAEALDLVQEDLDDELHGQIIHAMKKSAEFIWRSGEILFQKRGDKIVANHDAGAACAMQKLFDLTGDKKYREWGETILTDLISSQSEEGWFHEYGGADIGYSTVTLYFLANYRRLSSNINLDRPIKLLLNLLSYFVHPDGSIGGEYGTRQTFVVMPSAFELLIDLDPVAQSIANKLVLGFRRGKAATPEYLDDENLCSFPMISFLQAASIPIDDTQKDHPLPFEKSDYMRYYPDCGLFSAKSGNQYLVGSAKKGGVYRVYDIPQKNLLFMNSGILARRSNGVVLFSNHYQDNAKVSIDNQHLHLEVPLAAFRETRPTPFKTAVSRIIFPLLSRFSLLKKLLKAILRNMLITGKKDSKTWLIRDFIFDAKGISVDDSLVGLNMRSDVAIGVTHFPSVYFYTRGIFLNLDEYKFDYQLQPDEGPTGMFRMSNFIPNTESNKISM